MAVEINSIHLVGGTRHEHIASVRWTNPSSGDSGESTRETMVDWIENKNGSAYVTDGQNTVSVGVVNASPRYIRTSADGVWTDNLLALPRF